MCVPLLKFKFTNKLSIIRFWSLLYQEFYISGPGRVCEEVACGPTNNFCNSWIETSKKTNNTMNQDPWRNFSRGLLTLVYGVHTRVMSAIELRRLSSFSPWHTPHQPGAFFSYFFISLNSELHYNMYIFGNWGLQKEKENLYSRTHINLYSILNLRGLWLTKCKIRCSYNQ